MVSAHQQAHWDIRFHQNIRDVKELHPLYYLNNRIFSIDHSLSLSAYSYTASHLPEVPHRFFHTDILKALTFQHREPSQQSLIRMPHL